MRKILLIVVYLLFTYSLLGQSNIIKARFFIAPSNPFPYSVGVGFERMILKNVSTQILLNKFGFDMRSTDGSVKTTNSIVPEMRYYFGSDNINKSYFIGLFTELSTTKTEPAVVQIEDKAFIKEKELLVNPGLLIGKHFKIAKKWYWEMYIGPKHIFKKETRTYLVNNEYLSEIKYLKYWSLRFGLNFGFRF